MMAAVTSFRKIYRSGAGLSRNTQRVVSVFRAASAVLSAVSVVLDGILLIFAAIRGAQQRDELQMSVKRILFGGDTKHTDKVFPTIVPSENWLLVDFRFKRFMLRSGRRRGTSAK